MELLESPPKFKTPRTTLPAAAGSFLNGADCDAMETLQLMTLKSVSWYSSEAVIALEDGELDKPISAARRTLPKQSPAISVNVKPPARTFPSQCRDQQAVIRLTIKRVVTKSKKLFQHKSVKKVSRTKRNRSSTANRRHFVVGNLPVVGGNSSSTSITSMGSEIFQSCFRPRRF